MKEREIVIPALEKAPDKIPVGNWTDYEIAVLRKYRPTKDDALIGKEIGRTVDAVAKKARQLGIYKQKRTCPRAANTARSLSAVIARPSA